MTRHSQITINVPLRVAAPLLRVCCQRRVHTGVAGYQLFLHNTSQQANLAVRHDRQRTASCVAPTTWITREHTTAAEQSSAKRAGVKRQGREAEHSPPARAEVKKTWTYSSTAPTSSWRSA
jgi:GTP cyclohydrolase FolE2